MSNITPFDISELKPNEVFVFGSNTAGRHGAGAARAALQWGAIYGQGEGLHGQTYAIATLNERLGQRNIEAIGADVARFVDFAKLNPQLHFLVTEIGCGLAGFTVEQIAPFFFGIDLPNVSLPKRFIDAQT